MRPAQIAWTALVIGVLGYEILAADGELLSEEVDRWLVDHPFITSAGIALTAAHLLNMLPAKVDPFALLALGKRLVP